MNERLNRDLTQAAEWLRAIHDWLLETDTDMLLPDGVLDTDPKNIAETLEGWIGVLNDQTVKTQANQRDSAHVSQDATLRTRR